ncbi:hypothetical protein RHSIM_Rhsim02G0166900 [Rhododendron simsii]|uniref:RNase H type-1 domain-containing protein n=1 Tax=Rhododendron simsii TaxID=118357 RepID=A0A834H8Y3_RHOSS|nr:hypothetical protein RHSIM_Rhsim02G0166900 [Rhododendron simsii]
MSLLVEQIKSLQAQVTEGKQKAFPFEEGSFDVPKTKFTRGNRHFFADPMSSNLNLILMAMIDDMVKKQVKKAKEKDDEGFRMITKPHPAWVDTVPFPPGFSQPEFKMFGGTGDPRQHTAHFLSRCGPIAQNEALCLQLFVQSLEGSAFTWYSNLPEGSIQGWDFMVKEFLKQFCNTQRRVGVPELIETKQRDNEPVTDFIARWRALTFACPQKFKQLELIRMCLNNFRHELSTALMAQTFEGFNDLYADIQIRSCPEDDEKARVFARREGTNQAKIIVALKEEKYKIPQNYAIGGEHILNHPYLEWVEMVLFPRGYSIPHFPLYNGVGCPRCHLVHFLAPCGNTIRSQALLLRQFVLSLGGWAADWYFSLPPNSILDWDTMAERFYRRFYTPWPMELEMWEPLPDESVSFQTYELLEGTAEQKLESALDQRDMGINMVQINDEPKEGDGKEVVHVCKTYLTYKKQPRNQPSQNLQVLDTQGEVPKEEEQVKYDVLTHLKKIPALVSIYDALMMSPELRKSLSYALSNPDDFCKEVQEKGQESTITCLSTIAFGDEDMYAETPDHNQPLFITGLILDTKISRVLVDGGSAVNLLPKRALGIIGVRLSQLRPCHLVIQGFNQNEQRPMGKIKLRTKFGGIEEDTEFLVIDVDTSYNALLGRPWSHNHMAVPSTYHQCIKYPLPPPINEGIIVADNDPFNGVEAYYADARFYTKASQSKARSSTEIDTKSMKAQTRRAFRYIPKSQRKSGASALAPIDPTLELKDAFVLPLRKAECTYVDNYRKFVVPAKAKGMKPIVFHSLGDMEKKVQDDNLKTMELSIPIRPNYAANVTKMLVKAGLDREKPIPTQSEEGGQAIIDELRKVNLGDKGENKPTFISANLTEEEAQRYISFLKEHRDVFAWTYNEMLGLDPGVAVHRLAIHPEKRPVKQAPRRTRPELTSPNGQKQEDLKNNKSGIGVVFVTPNNAIIPHSFALTEGCSNNVAEYEAIIAGLELALQIPIEELLVYGDSELVIKQLRGEYIVKKASLAPYHERASQLLSQFRKINIFHVKRRINAQADSLASLAASLSLPDRETITVTVGERRVLQPLTEISGVLPVFATTTKEGDEDWREPFINYLQHGRLLEDKAKRAEVRR